MASSWLGLEAREVKLLGAVPQGFPSIGFPAIHWTDVNQLLPLAFACFLLARWRRLRSGVCLRPGTWEARCEQEFLALAASNLAAALGRGLPISGGMSQSLVNEGGGRVRAFRSLGAGCVLVVVLFFSHQLSALPQPVLAAVVLVAVAGLFKLST